MNRQTLLSIVASLSGTSVALATVNAGCQAPAAATSVVGWKSRIAQFCRSRVSRRGMSIELEYPGPTLHRRRAVRESTAARGGMFSRPLDLTGARGLVTRLAGFDRVFRLPGQESPACHRAEGTSMSVTKGPFFAFRLGSAQVFPGAIPSAPPGAQRWERVSRKATPRAHSASLTDRITGPTTFEVQPPLRRAYAGTMRALMAIALAACAGSPTGICEHKLDLGGGGWACAVRPSSTDPRIADYFGLHAVAGPATVGAETPVLVFFVGTGGRPALPDGTFTIWQLLVDGAAAGYLVLAVAYDAERALFELCGDDVDCYEPVRWEVVTGQDAAAPYRDLKQVAVPGDTDHRLIALAAALVEGRVIAALPAGLAGELDWSHLRVGGHSQGGGQAGVIARRRAVERVCMFGAPVDASSALVPASWIGGDWATPVSRRRVVVHQADSFYPKISANADTMGMVAGVELRVLDVPTSNPHAFGSHVDHPVARDARLWACFSAD